MLCVDEYNRLVDFFDKYYISGFTNVNIYLKIYVHFGLTDSTGAPRRVASATAKLAPRETLTFGFIAAGISIGMPMNFAAFLEYLSFFY